MEFKNLRNTASLQINENRCVGCGLCTNVCPHDVLIIENRTIHIKDIDLCMECGACSRNCPAEALSVRSGVGCAAAIISSKLSKSGQCSCG